MLKGFVLVFQCDGATFLALDLGGGASTEFLDVRTNFRGDVLACRLDVALRNEVEVLCGAERKCEERGWSQQRGSGRARAKLARG